MNKDELRQTRVNYEELRQRAGKAAQHSSVPPSTAQYNQEEPSTPGDRQMFEILPQHEIPES